ncbi:MAG: UDP-3-O-acyl-N-acetylglucosamine deacetylase, partial [Planctomycetaceae bacterium]|nr:UDP-3-O-acyl-N-acetylglucosamine deacetylase [Planctomycetaceae bacterium]
MTGRCQRTIERVTELTGFGLFTNADVTLRFCPADENHGIVFQRTDLAGSPKIPANIDYIASEERRTKLQRGNASVEMVEHLMAAMNGLQIDNCLVQLDAAELPGCDGSALPYVEALLDANIVTQSAKRETIVIGETVTIEQEQAVITAGPAWSGLRISYDLNYGSDSPIPPQLADFTITPELFATKIASARTFV